MMDSLNEQDPGLGKRKRSPENIGGPRPIPPPPPVSGNVAQINYLVKSRQDRLRLIESDNESFTDSLALIEDYEGVIKRHESFAANLGAKLVGPLLLKSFEKLFEGPIKILHNTYSNPVTWLDIVEFARANPPEFVLTDQPFGTKVCQFWINQAKVEISEDDYRLITSGAPERMIPSQPIIDDELAELGTMEILDQRISMLIKKADAVASRARQLNYVLKGRKTGLQSRRNVSTGSPLSNAEISGTAGSENASARFSSTNVNGDPSSPLHLDLLRQFSAPDRKPQVPSSSARPKSHRPTASTDSPHSFQSVNAPTDSPSSHKNRRASQARDDDANSSGQYKALMAARIDKLAKGGGIWPPCDRCRRLKIDCHKHLTACQGCTKKHAKCAWREVTDEEAGMVMAADGTIDEAFGDAVDNSSAANVGGRGRESASASASVSLDPAGAMSVGPETNAENSGLGEMHDGLTTTADGTGVEDRGYSVPGMHGHGHGHVEKRERDEQMNENHILLSQIASAAATTGMR